MTAQTDTYNGWTNYETWGCNLILDNDEGTYNEVRDMARDCFTYSTDHPNVDAGIWTEREAATFTLEDRIKAFTERLCGLDDSLGVPEPSMMARQLLGAAIDAVNFREIAEHNLDEIA